MLLMQSVLLFTLVSPTPRDGWALVILIPTCQWANFSMTRMCVGENKRIQKLIKIVITIIITMEAYQKSNICCRSDCATFVLIHLSFFYLGSLFSTHVDEWLFTHFVTRWGLRTPLSRALDPPLSQALDPPLSQTLDPSLSRALDLPLSQALDPPLSRSLDHLSLELWTHPSLELWTHSSLELWTHPSFKLWTHLSLELWTQLSRALDPPLSQALEPSLSRALDPPLSRSLDPPL